MNLNRKVGIVTLVFFIGFCALTPAYFHLNQTNLLINTIMSICVGMVLSFGGWLMVMETNKDNKEKKPKKEWDGEHP